jgi:hypothetical protein
MRRTTLALLLSLLIPASLGLAHAPTATALPNEGDWAWTTPYVDATVPAFRAVAPGPGFSFYAGGDGWMGQWTVTRIDTSADSEGYTYWTDTRLGPESMGASLSLLKSDAAGDLYAVGMDGINGGDIYIVKYSKDSAKGSPVVSWWKSWNGPKHLADYPLAAVVTKGGDLLVAGGTGNAGGYDDAVLLRYSPAGKLRWKYIMATSLYDTFKGVGVDANGNSYVTGIRAGTMGSSQMVTLKIDAKGHKVWQRTITGLGISYSGDFLKVKGSSVYVAGDLYKYRDFPVAAKYSLAGKRAWAWTDGGDVSSVRGMTVDGKGRVVLVGTMETDYGAGEFTAGYLDFVAPDGSGMAASAVLTADYDPSVYGLIPYTVTTDSTNGVWVTGEWHTNLAGTEGNALVVRLVLIDTTIGIDRIWRVDGPASGADAFLGLLIQPHNGTFAVGTEYGPTGPRAVADCLSP